VSTVGERVAGKVAFITGAARGQGRSHALRLAEEGADIIAVDIEDEIGSVDYGLSTEDDMAETVKLVQGLGRRIVASKADVRDYDRLKAAVDEGVQELGRLDIVCANAGIFPVPASGITPQMWKDTIDVNLTGTWHTCQAAIPHLVEQGSGGSIIITSSTAGLEAYPGFSHYVSSKHALVGLMRTLALELAPSFIRVNTIHPTTANTQLVMNEITYRSIRPDLANPAQDDARDVFVAKNALPVPFIEPRDISNVVLFLASDESRYITGVALPVDAGCLIK
jgi:SDR family mycofactocin-dependent oxidoreductase